MENHDVFADIALTQHLTEKDGMREIEPPARSPDVLTPSERQAAAVAEPSYEERLRQFQAGLEGLRRQYRPFMQNLVPPAEPLRRREEIREMDFRYAESSGRDFDDALAGGGKWETVTLPDYRGPAGEAGRWTGYYRTTFEWSGLPLPSGRAVFLVFKGVDYRANVYVNRRLAGSHEGFFAPFEMDITDCLQPHNELLVEVKNDYSILGVDGTPLDGDKIYAATGPGWDNPDTGWHHCPPGAGIYQPVCIEERAAECVTDVFARPDIDRKTVEFRVGIYNRFARVLRNFVVEIEIRPRNFSGGGPKTHRFAAGYMGPGQNEYRYRVDMPPFRLWGPDEPWLYTARVRLLHTGARIDCRDVTFGMRKFHMDESADPKGSLFLNNQPIVLRGANEMGHLQQCVMREDYRQLTDDILIAKLAHLNYYRVTQRPVQEEIYEYFDMLGMMHQCDFPLFGFLRRNQTAEALRQVGEMERLIRSHPSTVMVSLINEPMVLRDLPGDEPKYVRRMKEKGHRHLFRDELEAFFAAARRMIYIENPDRVVKNVEGDYDPPTAEGLSDFHCYTMWYTNHALPFGKLYKGYLPAIRKGWKTGCGEYGTEGLDSYALMCRRYPSRWLPAHPADPWKPDRIVRAQTYALHGDWFAEQRDIRSWIAYSQAHQARATALMTDAFRRRTDWIVSTAVHLLIDAWPSGWIKALVGADRVPKPGYFALTDSLKPLRIHIRCDRWTAYAGDMVEAEVWLLNDTAQERRDCLAVVTLRTSDRPVASYEQKCGIGAVASGCVGRVCVKLPAVSNRETVFLDAALFCSDGRKLDECRFSIETYERSVWLGQPVAWVGAPARAMLQELGVPAVPFDGGESSRTVVVSSPEAYESVRGAVQDMVKADGCAVFIRDAQGVMAGGIGSETFACRVRGGVYFAAPDMKLTALGFRPDDFSYWYNADTDQIDFTADAFVDCPGMEPLLFTYGPPGPETGKPKRTAVGAMPFGGGRVAAVALPLAGRLSVNPALDRLLLWLMGQHRMRGETDTPT